MLSRTKGLSSPKGLDSTRGIAKAPGLSSPKGLSRVGKLGEVKENETSVLKKEERKRQLFGQQKKHESISVDLYVHPYKILVRKELGKIFISYGLVYAGKGPGIVMLVPEMVGSSLKSFFNEKVVSASSFPLQDCELYVRVDYSRGEATKAYIEQVVVLERKPNSAYYLIGKVKNGVPTQELRSDVFSFKTDSSSGSSVSGSSSSSSSSSGSPSSGSPSSGSSSKPSHSGKNAIFKVGDSYHAFCAEEADRFYLKYYHVVETSGDFSVALPNLWKKCVQSHFVQSVVDYSGGAVRVRSIEDGVYLFEPWLQDSKRIVVVVFAGLAHGSQDSMEERSEEQYLKNQAFYKELQE